MKLYQKYLKEREGIDCVYTDHCFITYKLYDDNTAVVIDMYSDSEVRGKGIMLDFVKDLFKEFKKREIETVFGMTYDSTNGSERSEELLKKFGFKCMGYDPIDKDKKNYYLNLTEVNNGK